MPRVDCTSPALLKIHINLPALAVEIPSRRASCESVNDSPIVSARANCNRQRRPYSS